MIKNDGNIMNLYKYRRALKETGITLIALVVTIIVLLILAGVTLSIAIDNGGLIGRAKEAKIIKEEADIKEQKILNDVADYMESYESENKVVKISEIKTKPNEEVVPVSKYTKIVAEDELGNKIIIPKGFGITNDSCTNVEQGIVIEDADNSRETKGSQFVWIPVGDINVSESINPSGTLHISLARYMFDDQTGVGNIVQEQVGPNYTATTSSSAIDNFYEFADDTESRNVINKTYNNDKAYNLSKFVESAIKNGGYYIGRFEAGIKGTTSSSTSEFITGTVSKNSTTNAQIIVKANVGVWNNITQKNASTVSKNMYSNSEDISSDLTNSYAWDTAIMFIEKCGTNNNYANFHHPYNGLIATGYNGPSGTDKQCNIFDMGGDVSEWNTETFNQNRGESIRGGDVLYNTRTVKSRLYPTYRQYQTDYCMSWLGFRPIVYLNN